MDGKELDLGVFMGKPKLPPNIVYVLPVYHFS
jgi:hypothetical protein